jgi:histidine phosphotransfer protein HptB
MTPQDTPPPITDPAAWAELQASAGDDFAAELLDTFIQELPGMLAALREALSGADAAGFKRAAHSIKSNAMTFGALRLGAGARALELAGLGADAGADARAVAALEADCTAAVAALQAQAHG